MVTKNYRFADVAFTLQMQYPYLEKQCRSYEVEEPGILIAASDEEIEREDQSGVSSSNGMLESLAVYRKISEIMVEHDTFLFHCSAVALDGQAYLFTAPSGTGKSTHTRLWREVFGERAVMVNDDKPLIQVREDAIYVCGTPWNGKHNLDSNQKVPVKGICILERGTVNNIETISAADAFPYLFRQVYRPADQTKLIRTITLLKQAFSFFSLNSTHDHTGTAIILPCLHDFFVFLACDLFCRIVCHTGKIVFLCCQKQAFHGNLFRLWLRFPLFKDRTDQLDEIFGCKNFWSDR